MRERTRGDTGKKTEGDERGAERIGEGAEWKEFHPLLCHKTFEDDPRSLSDGKARDVNPAINRVPVQTGAD